MGDQSKFKLLVHVYELLDDVVVVTERKHLVDQKHQGEVASRLLEIRLYLKFFFVFLCLGNLHEISANVGSLDARHGKQEILDQKGLLDLHWEGAKVLGSLF